MTTNLPKVIVVGDPQLGVLLANSGAQWEIQPVATTVTGMWDAIDAGQLSPDSACVIFTDGTSATPDELELSLATFAPYCPTFLFADPARGQQIVSRSKQLAPTLESGDPSAPIWILPITDAGKALDIIRQQTQPKITWNPIVMEPVPTPQQAPLPPVAPVPAPQPVPAPVATPAAPVYAPQTNAATPQPQQMRSYEQAHAYADHVIEQARTSIPKPPDAIPGQKTIACMSSKGGSGKSTTALCLAGMISRASAAAGDPKRVVLVDLDTRDGQVGSLIGQFMPTAISIRVLPRWDAESVKANLVHDKKLGIDALLAPVRPRNADDVGPEFYRTIIGILQTTHDVVVLDCSVNYLDPLLGTAFAMSDEILFVTTLATTSVQGMARSLTELFAEPSDGGLGIPREKVGIVANQVVQNVGMGRDKLLKAALGAPLLGQIPSDQDAVLIATNTQSMSNLLKHDKLGPRYYELAEYCLPGWNLAPFTPAMAEFVQRKQAAMQQPKQPPQDPPPGEQKKGFFRR